MTRHLSVLPGLVLFLAATSSISAGFHVSPAGRDANPGTADQPFATLTHAQQAARAVAGQEPVTVWVHAGTYYLPETLRFTPQDSGTETAPVVYEAAAGEEVVLSGGRRLALDWEPHRDGIFKAPTPPGLQIDQLFVNGWRQPMARYPDFDPNQRIYNGYAAEAFSPQRAARWSDPAGGFIHAMHRAHWGGYHYRITGKNADHTVTYEGGWQNNRQMGMHPEHRYVENIFEELDAPGEWFHDQGGSRLYYYPPPGLNLSEATVEVVRLRHLLEFQGQHDPRSEPGPAAPDAKSRHETVRFITLRGFTFRHAARTFMDTREPLLRSDWTIYRGGAVLFEGAEDCVLTDCRFDQVGGNAVFVNRYNRRLTIRNCLIRDSGGNGIALVGDPQAVRNPLFEYGQRQSRAALDLTPGPRTDNYPADCLVEDCLITRIGRVEKQAAAIQISMSRDITIRHCSIYEVPRAGINLSEGTWGGHVIEGCDVFDTVLETGDHGSFNSWGRDRFWGLKDVSPAELPTLALLDAVRPTVIRNSRWRCDHGWDIDLDDGSSNFEIYNNLMLRGGLKLREGFHRTVRNNITVNNTFHPHVWYDQSGDTVTANIFMGAYRPAGGMPQGPWGREIDHNLFTTSQADRDKFAAHGCDAHSLVADPLFIDPAHGDYRVQNQSPALQLGFENFPMDQFGVRTPWLRELARMPALPELRPGLDSSGSGGASSQAQAHYWLQARVRELQGEEFSAFGVSRESGGVHLTKVPDDSPAAAAGFWAGDLIQRVNDQPVRGLADLWREQNRAAGAVLKVGVIRGQQPQELRVEAYPYFVLENADHTDFTTIALSGPGPILALQRIAARPETANEPLAILKDGRLDRHYGPVFVNGVSQGAYKVDLGRICRVAAIHTWSHNQNGNRAAQRFVLFGSAAAQDPGWDLDNRALFVPIAEVDTTGVRAQTFQATALRAAPGHDLGAFRWVIWRVHPVTELQENTAFQELQVIERRGPDRDR